MLNLNTIAPAIPPTIALVSVQNLQLFQTVLEHHLSQCRESQYQELH